MAETEVLSVVTCKGQITVPVEIRRALGLKEGDLVSVRRDGDGAKVTPARSRVDASFGAVPALKEPLTDREMTDVAWEEHARHVAREGSHGVS